MDRPGIPEQLARLEHFWCPLLGQPVRFGYCVRAGQPGPCSRIVYCWGAHKQAGGLARALGAQATSGPGRLERVLRAIGKERGR